jgi:outer membrane protein
MKNIKLLPVLFLGILMISANNIKAQKYAYVDTEYILSNIPEYNDAQDELDALSKKWQKEIEAKHKELKEMYKKYQA